MLNSLLGSFIVRGSVDLAIEGIAWQPLTPASGIHAKCLAIGGDLSDSVVTLMAFPAGSWIWAVMGARPLHFGLGVWLSAYWTTEKTERLQLFGDIELDPHSLKSLTGATVPFTNWQCTSDARLRKCTSPIRDLVLIVGSLL